MSEAISVFLSSNPTDIVITALIILFMSFLGKSKKARESNRNKKKSSLSFMDFMIGLRKWDHIYKKR